MSNPTVTTEFAMPDPGANPLNLIQLFTLANTLVSSVINTESFNTYVIQNGTPDVEDQGKVWFEKDTNGRPVAIKVFYQGDWRRVYNGMKGEIRGYTGNPADDFETTGTNPGRGKTTGIYDGWALCNGKNGTPDLSDKFLIGAHMNDADGHTGYHADKGGWTTFVDSKADLNTGGSKDNMIAQNNLPALDNSIVDPSPPFTQQKPGLWINGKEWKDAPETEHNDAQIIVDSHYANLRNHGIKLLTYGADPPGNPSVPPNPQIGLPALPPFYTLAWITFIGYT